jgi:hypothetical protein
VYTLNGTAKGTAKVKCQSELHSQDSLEHLKWNVSTAMCNVVSLLNCVTNKKFVLRHGSHAMSQATSQ